MKDVARVLHFGSGVLALSLLMIPPVLRAEDATPEKSPTMIVKNDPGKEGMPSAKTNATVKGPTVTRKFTKEEFKLKLLREKFDANGDGQIDEGEKKEMDAYLAMMAEKYRQGLAKYDANKNGVLDPEEKRKMQEDTVRNERNEHQRAISDMQLRQRQQQRLNMPAPRDFTAPTRR